MFPFPAEHSRDQRANVTTLAQKTAMFNTYFTQPIYAFLSSFKQNATEDDLELLISADSRTDCPDEADEKQYRPRKWLDGRRRISDLLPLLSHLLPSFLLQGRPGADDELRQARPSTSSLDGLRGLAACSVMNYHILYAYQSFVFYGYGLSSEVARSCARPEDLATLSHWWHQLPIIRLIYSGTWPISVFFVISGFVLSYSILLEADPTSETPATISAGKVGLRLLRRPVRLYLPPIIATMCTMIVIQLGAYEYGHHLALDTSWIPVIQEVHHQRMESFGAQMLDWLHQIWKMCRVFWWGDFFNPYDVHLWTIPAEFRCSLAVFLILPVYANMRQAIRRVLMGVVIVYVYQLDRWDVALFFVGLLVADTSSTSHSRTCGKHPASEEYAKCQHMAIMAFETACLLASLYIMSAPDLCISNTPGFRLLAHLIPSSDPAPFRFLPNLGGTLLVIIITHAHIARDNGIISTFLNSRLLQYSGNVSYSLYIVHGPLIHTVGYALFPFFWTMTGTEDTWRYVVGFVAAYMTLVMIIVWVADLFWRLVDRPSTRVAGKLQRIMTL